MVIDVKQQKFIDIFKWFVISQPILDMLTYFSIVYFGLNITVGIIVRVLFLAISLIYICFGNNHPWKKYIITYLAFLFIILGIGFVVNFFTKPEFYLFSEMQFLIKTIYFPVMICTILLLFLPGSKLADIKKYLLSSVSIAMVLVGLSIIIAVLTNTAKLTYKPGYPKIGYIGWFFAGNEIGAIVAIAFPLVLIYAILKTRQLKDIVFWVPTLLLAVSALIIGTKVSYLAVTITIILSLICNLLYWILQRRAANVNSSAKNVLLCNLVLAIIFFAVTPLTPTYSNMKDEYTTVNEAVQKEEPVVIEEKVAEAEQASFLDSKLLTILLSKRNLYIKPVLEDYADAGLFNKLFGLGYAGYYTGEPKLIEMDFLDLFFAYGLLGFLVICLPLFYIFWRVLRLLFRNVGAFFGTDHILLLVSAGLGLGIAFLAGHVLFAPAVSVYLAITLVLLFYYSHEH
ncbi:O-antigen ligase family protein [Pallidibacillus pasinlerensis]|uniref:O-antigen ligase family protein n=1 Tax=Pallidibacillus pasinlerensis TaxID=2703818 RepID=A0ABX0A971_9BACI|nr:O-antigen ligase family protein [Pallidibacillus pasinlerensis]NCU17677.1 O-antigen ligase family protein [Pallidibacillus pasinlerensis]